MRPTLIRAQPPSRRAAPLQSGSSRAPRGAPRGLSPLLTARVPSSAGRGASRRFTRRSLCPTRLTCLTYTRPNRAAGPRSLWASWMGLPRATGVPRERLSASTDSRPTSSSPAWPRGPPTPTRLRLCPPERCWGSRKQRRQRRPAAWRPPLRAWACPWRSRPPTPPRCPSPSSPAACPAAPCARALPSSGRARSAAWRRSASQTSLSLQNPSRAASAPRSRAGSRCSRSPTWTQRWPTVPSPSRRAAAAGICGRSS
mmetsp:Transcript_14807/g.39851  ORF Transcript_14807/g.39851 Transcript_14807/m.39851 type:complete len:256 (-) Transcript_14807:187-954(-)